MSDRPETTIRAGWRFWMVVAFLAPIALRLYVKDRWNV
jgi:hypothetical protein